VTGRPIRLVLDTTAALAYAHSSDAVGETIREVLDENAGYAIPVICLAEAAAQLDDRRLPLLDLLVAHPYAVEVPLPQNWRALATACRLYGSVAHAAAMTAAALHHAYVLTSEPAAHGGDDVDGVIGI
jgi:hypothetical protein